LLENLIAVSSDDTAESPVEKNIRDLACFNVHISTEFDSLIQEGHPNLEPNLVDFFGAPTQAVGTAVNSPRISSYVSPG